VEAALAFYVPTPLAVTSLSTADTTIALPEKGQLLSTTTFFYRTAALLAIKSLCWRWRDNDTCWSCSIAQKQTKNLSEPYAMQLLGQQANIHVPKVLLAWTDKTGRTHLIIERIKGKEIGPFCQV
jgi:hypothetical protein